MGLFSSRTVTYVSATAYNLAGDEDLRPDFLKATLIGNALSEGERSFGETLLAAQMQGTGMQQRKFFQWARTNYAPGLPQASITGVREVDTAAVSTEIAGQLFLGSSDVLDVARAVIDNADAFYWAEAWVRLYHPTLSEEEWSHDYDRQAQEIVIDLVGTQVRLAAPDDLLWALAEPGRRLLFASYAVTSFDAVSGQSVQGTTEMFVYRMGTGNLVLDELEPPEQVIDEFFPVLPLRIDNRSIADPMHSEEYPAVEKAYKRLTGKRLGKLLESIEDNAAIGDIDYAFLVQGVSLNVKERDCKAYLYAFFLELIQAQTSGHESFMAYLHGNMANYRATIEWQNWINSTHDEYRYEATETSFPAKVPAASSPPPQNILKILSPGATGYEQQLRWNFIKETQHAGNARRFDGDVSRELLKPGEYWFHVMPDYRVITRILERERDGEYVKHIYTNYSRVFLFHQKGRHRYSRLELVGLEHLNFVYAGQAVKITLPEALADEEESGFIIPLHYPTLRKLSLLKATQMTTANTWVVFNSYQQVKVRWYQRGIFKIVLVIAAVIVTVVFPPAGGLASATGLLGTNLAVGTFLGASAASAAIVGAVVNGIAAMLLTKLVTKQSTKIFGEKLGAVIGTIVSFVAMTYGSQFMATGNLNVDWGAIMNVDNILNLTNSVSRAYTAWLGADTAELYDEMGNLKTEYENKLEDIQELSDEVLGMTSGIIDPMMFTDAADQFNESSDAFLGRTLLTGSEIAELTHNLIEDFPEISLSLPKAFA
jgi:hypothetical protein